MPLPPTPDPPAPAPPELALLVCTRDRGAYLPATLAALGAVRSRHAWELVLVDNGSRDETPALLRRFAAEAARAPAVPGAPAAVTVVDEPRPGLTRARNAGLRRTRAPIVCFTDDDCYPAPDLLDRWAEVFADPAVGYGGGRVGLYDPADHPITVKMLDVADPRAPYAYVPAGLIQGANMAFRRPLVLAAGGFDPDLGPGTPFNCEDVDMAGRVAALGAAGGFFPGPLVWHHHRRRAGPAVDALERSYAQGFGAHRMTLLLRRGSRKHGLYAWAQMLREAAGGFGDRRRRAHAGHELLGGARYLAYRTGRRLGWGLAGGRR